jgi:Icc-related predicted phosphoesterase
MKFINAGKFYKADVIILGGDMTGKAIVPIVRHDCSCEATFGGKTWTLPLEKAGELEEAITERGYYPYFTTSEEIEKLKSDTAIVDKLFLNLMIDRVMRWMKIADERLKNTNIKCFVCPGNDDKQEIDQIIEESRFVKNAEGKVIEIDNCHEMISLGWTNPTPWNTYKECSEEELYQKIEKLTSQVQNIDNCIFNLHAPPYGSGIDSAPEIDKTLKQMTRTFVPVGSTAVMNAVQKFQPLLGLHGHVHEGRGFIKIGRTLCINPGSTYEQGVLLGVLINIDEKKVKSYMPIVG